MSFETRASSQVTRGGNGGRSAVAAAAAAAAGDTHDRNKTVLLGKPKKKDPIDQIAALLTSVSHVERCGLPRRQARPGAASEVGGWEILCATSLLRAL